MDRARQLLNERDAAKRRLIQIEAELAEERRAYERAQGLLVALHPARFEALIRSQAA